MKNKKLTTDQVYGILKKFVIDEVDGADFEFGLQESLNVMKRWWLKNKSKFGDEDLTEEIEPATPHVLYIINHPTLIEPVYNPSGVPVQIYDTSAQILYRVVMQDGSLPIELFTGSYIECINWQTRNCKKI